MILANEAWPLYALTSLDQLGTADIDKILNVKQKIKPKTIILEQYWGYLNVFNENETNQLPPIRGKKINHEIELLEKEKKKLTVPLGPLYNISKDEFLVLRKTLPNIWIRISFEPIIHQLQAHSFSLKILGEVEFLCWLPKFQPHHEEKKLPLIYETFRNIGKIKWYTKHDVKTVF